MLAVLLFFSTPQAKSLNSRPKAHKETVTKLQSMSVEVRNSHTGLSAPVCLLFSSADASWFSFAYLQMRVDVCVVVMEMS